MNGGREIGLMSHNKLIHYMTVLEKKYIIFNFTTIMSCILLIFSLFFIPEPANVMFIPFLFLIILFLSTTLIKSNKFLEFF